MPRCDNVRKGFIEHEAYIQLLTALPEYLRPVVTMAYCTGMRRGEICSLRWENVDLLNRLIRLNAGETKNGEGRVIPMCDRLLDALTSQLHVRNTTVPDCPFVFFRIVKTKENPVPRWLPIGDFRKVWDTACAASGLTGRIFHDLRRSAVRLLIRSGVQERVAMMISGHKTRSVFDRYAIVSEQDLTDAVRKLQKFQEAAEPACAPAETQPGASPARPAFIN
jgi:integrase